MKESRILQIKLGIMLLPFLPLYLWLWLWLFIAKVSEDVEEWNDKWSNSLGAWLVAHGYPLDDVTAKLRSARYKENKMKEEMD